MPFFRLCLFAYLLFIQPMIAEDGLKIDLQNPLLFEGKLTTTEGGVIEGVNFRLQARHISLWRMENGENYFIRAQQDLLMRYGPYFFVGDSFWYDTSKERGEILGLRSFYAPWIFGAERAFLSDGERVILNQAYFTTSFSVPCEWQLNVRRAELDRCKFLTASGVVLRLIRFPFAYLPRFKVNLDNFIDVPIRYRFRWGGKQGPRISILYNIIDYPLFSADLRCDYRFSRGPAFGIETSSRDSQGCDFFFTRNYIARDSSLFETSRRLRYRFQGLLSKKFLTRAFDLHITYDKLSDQEMPRDYSEKDFEELTAGRTQLHLSHRNRRWIGDLYIRKRFNDFETVKEMTPLISTRLHPWRLGWSGIISDHAMQFGYYEFKYSKNQGMSRDFNSTRLELRHRFYRPFAVLPLMVTPQVELISIYYGNDANQSSQLLATVNLQLFVHSRFIRPFGSLLHSICPYVLFDSYTQPTSAPDDHFIFDLWDGWSRLDLLKVGVKQLLYRRAAPAPFGTFLASDLSLIALPATSYGSTSPYKIFFHCLLHPTYSLRYDLDLVWGVKRKELEEFNLRCQWTYSEDLAMQFEYRSRNAYHWRKLDPDNYMMEAFRTPAELRASAVSDQRNTLLFHLYHNICHNLALEMKLRYGFERKDQPPYCEYQLTFPWTIRSFWHLKLSYQKLEAESRFTFSITVGEKQPKARRLYDPTVQGV